MELGITCFLTDRDMAPADLARAVEERGFASLYLPEHTHLPVRAATPPALVEGVRADDYKRSLDPFVALATAAPVTYSNIQRGYAGTGNLNTEPQFVSTSAPDYHLASTSPCIDAGDPEALAVEEPAPNGDRINMGAYGGTRQATKGVTHTIFYVDGQAGRDTNNGRSRTNPFATVQKAIKALTMAKLS